MLIAALTFGPASVWSWCAVGAAVVLVPLAWLSLQPAGARSRTLAVGLALRTLGVALLIVTLLDPQWTEQRAVRGANVLAVVADNSLGLTVTDDGATQSRAAQLQATLSGPGSSWLEALGETYQVRSYTFDRELRRTGDFATLDFRGDRSALAGALARLRERFAGQPLAGVVLFTDGNATDLAPDTLPDLTGLPPLYPVVVGAGEVRDLRVERVTVRQTPFDDAPVTLEATIAGPGLAGERVQLVVRPLGSDAAAAGGETLPAPQEATVREAGTTANFSWKPVGGGLQFFEVAVSGDDPAAEATARNNRRAVVVDRGRTNYRVLYVSGRPSWDFKFLNRALADEPQLALVGLMRVARREPKFDFKGRAGESSNPMFRGFGREEEAPRYDQPVLVRLGTRDEQELRGGFPTTAEELFAYDAVMLDDLETSFFTTEQLALLRRFVSERGGGLLALGGADALEDGGYAESPLAAALPFYLDQKAPAAPHGELRWELSREGWLEPWVRVRPLEAEERARLNALPPVLVAHSLAALKPGATVLARLVDENGASFPALAAQSFGAGRVASLAVGDLWRMGLRGEGEQADLARFWRQLARWLVAEVPAAVTLRTTSTDDGAGTVLRVTARDRAWQLVDGAQVQITVARVAPGERASDGRGPDDSAGEMAATAGHDAAEQTGNARDAVGAGNAAGGTSFSSVTLRAEAVPEATGAYAARFGGRDAGAYRATVEVTDATGALLGRAETGWVQDPAADEFHRLAPNRALLTELARRTGGELVELADVAALAARLPSRSAPITESWSRPAWHNPAVFLAVLGCFLAEWVWRRWRGLA